MNTPTTYTVQQRGCGWPKKGAIYLSVLSDGKGGFYDMPLEQFLLDPVFELPEGFDLAPIETSLRVRMNFDGSMAMGADGRPIYDVWDWIGQSAYPNPVDWLEEIRRLGFHQLVPRTVEFSLLSAESCYIGVHNRAAVVDTSKVYPLRHDSRVTWKDCPFDIPDHANGSVPGTCPGVFAQYAIGGKDVGGGVVLRTMPSFTWYGFPAPEDLETRPAAFISLPIGMMADVLIYEDNERHTEVSALKALEELTAGLLNVTVIPWDQA